MGIETVIEVAAPPAAEGDDGEGKGDAEGEAEAEPEAKGDADGEEGGDGEAEGEKEPEAPPEPEYTNKAADLFALLGPWLDLFSLPPRG